MLLIFLFIINSHAWFFDEPKNEGNLETNNKQYNPICWVINCGETTEKDKGNTKFSLNPRCWFTNCDENHNTEFNPYCWFKNCENEEKENLWLTDDQIINWGKQKLQNLKCFFKECPPHVEKGAPEKDLTLYDKVKNFLYLATPQEPVIEHLLKSEWNPYCWHGECCNKESIPSDVKKLQLMVHQYLYGQHLTETVIDAITAHWNLNVKSPKALVLSFHGSVGVGKNYVASLIAKSLFKLEMKSKYVHYYNGRLDFSFQTDNDIHRRNLYHWLRSNVTECPKQLFIFDNIENMPAEIFNDLKPLLDYRDLVDGVDYRQTIFIFISSIGSSQIREEYEKLIKSGKKREDIVLSDFEKLISEGAYTHEGAFHNSDVIKFNLIDHYIPFLPLEEEHISNCIKFAFLIRNVKNPREEHINAIMDKLSWISTDHTRFSIAGCKSIASKVNLIVQKFYETQDDKSEL